MTQLFEGPRLKVKRATQLIEELHGLLGAFFLGGDAITVKLVPMGRSVLVEARAKQIPPEISLHLGDAIHNLRSALDLVAVELVRIGNNVPSKNLYFPIRDSKEQLEKRMRDPEIRLFGPAVCDLIEKEIKPYREGHPLIWALHQADIGDKHLGLVPTVGIAQVTVDIEDPIANGVIHGLTLAVFSGSAISPVAMDPTARITNARDIISRVYFPSDSSFGPVELVPTLRQCSGVVTAIIDGIEKAHNMK